MEKITSIQNPRIKNVVKLHKASERREQNLFLVEGLKEISFALNAGYKAHSLFWCAKLSVSIEYLSNISTIKNIPIFEITAEIFSKIAYRESSDGLMAVLHMQKLAFAQIRLKQNPFIIVLESIEKPGNLGAILRTADAAGVDAVFICDPRTDIYNPNVIRSSLGCIFTNQVLCCSNAEALDWFKQKGIKTLAALLSIDSKLYHQINYLNSIALVMGTESDGLSDFWIQNSEEQIIIPMLGKIDSLNVSVSTAIIVFEAMRQRNFK